MFHLRLVYGVLYAHAAVSGQQVVQQMKVSFRMPERRFKCGSNNMRLSDLRWRSRCNEMRKSTEEGTRM